MSNKIPQYIDLTLRLSVDEDSYQELINKGYTSEQILQKIRKEFTIHELPVPIWNYEVMDIEYSSGCGIGNALQTRIKKITEGKAL